MAIDPSAVSGAASPGAMEVGGRQLPADVVSSLRAASTETGIDFRFLVAQASLESGFQASAQSKRSSASGLFQFTSQTWLAMMREHGAHYGLGDLARKIALQPNGRLAAPDRATEKKILDLRQDVKLSALFAGEYARENGHRLERALGRSANAADLHLAHLLGPNGAIRFLKARDAGGAETAAAVVPAAARQNPAIFYDRGHTAQTVAAVYRRIEQRITQPIRQVAAFEPVAFKPGTGISGAILTGQKG